MEPFRGDGSVGFQDQRPFSQTVPPYPRSPFTTCAFMGSSLAAASRRREGMASCSVSLWPPPCYNIELQLAETIQIFSVERVEHTDILGAVPCFTSAPQGIHLYLQSLIWAINFYLLPPLCEKSHQPLFPAPGTQNPVLHFVMRSVIRSPT